jgi:hypothetical protein
MREKRVIFRNIKERWVILKRNVFSQDMRCWVGGSLFYLLGIWGGGVIGPKAPVRKQMTVFEAGRLHQYIPDDPASISGRNTLSFHPPTPTPPPPTPKD